MGNAGGGQLTMMLLTLSKAVMTKDVRVMLVRVGTQFTSCDAWIPAFDAALGVEVVEPAVAVPAGPLKEEFTLIVPKRFTLEEQDSGMAFTVTLKPGTGQDLAGTYRLRRRSMRPSEHHLVCRD